MSKDLAEIDFPCKSYKVTARQSRSILSKSPEIAMSFFDTHLSGCSPRKPCFKCQAYTLILEKMPDDSQRLFALIYLATKDDGPEANSLAPKNPAMSAPSEQSNSDILDMKWDELLEVGARTKKFLAAQSNIITIRDLVSKSEFDLLRIRLFGRNCLNDVIAELAKRNLHLYKPLNEIGMTPP